MKAIKLLDISNPRIIKETLNNLIEEHTQSLEQNANLFAKYLEDYNNIILAFKTETQEAMQQHIDETNTVIQEFKDSINIAMQQHKAEINVDIQNFKSNVNSTMQQYMNETNTIIKDFKEYAEGVLVNVDSTIGDLGSVLDEINGEVI